MNIASEFRRLLDEGRLNLPFPGEGETAARHRGLARIAKSNLALGRLVEAHVDAVAILHEAGKEPEPGLLYGVWASEMPGSGLCVRGQDLSGEKTFCSGSTIVDRALVTATMPEHRLVEIDLRARRDHIRFDDSQWATSAFAETHTATVCFDAVPLRDEDFVGPAGWYLSRPGFWHGACGPASCWAGGALRLVEHAVKNARDTNPHAVAHAGAMWASAWQLETILRRVGDEIDGEPGDTVAARIRALSVRHLVEKECVEVLRRFGRALGPRPLTFDRELSRHCQELELYVRQSHAEVDLEALGRDVSARERLAARGRRQKIHKIGL